MEDFGEKPAKGDGGGSNKPKTLLNEVRDLWNEFEGNNKKGKRKRKKLSYGRKLKEKKKRETIETW